MFSLRNIEYYLKIISVTPSYLKHCRKLKKANDAFNNWAQVENNHQLFKKCTRFFQKKLGPTGRLTVSQTFKAMVGGKIGYQMEN